MANNITVNWVEVTNINGVGGFHANYSQLYDSTTQRSTLDFGAVQAGKTTNIKAIVARFSAATTVSDLQFWLDSTNANAAGSTNTNLGTSDWEFYYCVVPKEKINFNFGETNFTEEQKKGGASLFQVSNGNENEIFSMSTVPRRVEDVPPNQFRQTLQISNGESVDSHLILLSVQTSSNANSGNTEGWYYRMNFLYS